MSLIYGTRPYATCRCRHYLSEKYWSIRYKIEGTPEISMFPGSVRTIIRLKGGMFRMQNVFV